ncbi:uncharacterized protein SPPG_07862 [Spizellomyces punctatus DAOM BR117]|uniref:Uncharacterized protein n=1 Tax=Spizellomyces punctatus (strain DAOM BR117) TaxID=645134 RepID=A0A0L0H6R0_SPIPD|nr:uncharacterized protein SPPG_07862 [Spizellomyces punctatus DAOM BR117]KNC96649.1 hypothetical protein SPPG_07862 [Spizellomyces punctatus DAOM BR117]|eukprot:XP_016604689.1 hypothetical protein SPPG_07862 [Spizellomyces punctatus DAOM BR117]
MEPSGPYPLPPETPPAAMSSWTMDIQGDGDDESSSSLMEISHFDSDNNPSAYESGDDLEGQPSRKRRKRRALRLPPEILTHVLRFAYTNSRRQFLNNALVNKEWAACALPVLWERIAPRSNFPLGLIVRSLDRLWRTLSMPNTSHDYASFPRAVAIQLHLKNNEFVSRRVVEEFSRIVELVPGIIKCFPKVKDLGLTLRVEEATIPLQATATAFLERLIRVTPPSTSLWLKLAGVAVLDSQCAALAERFGNVITDFHLTKCMGCTASGLRYFLKRAPRLQSLALYIPSLHDQLLGTIAEHNNQLMDLWLDLPMEEGAQPNDEESLRTFCTDLRLLMQRSSRLRRLRLRGVPLAPDRAHQMLQTVSEEGRELRSLSVLVWPPAPMGMDINTVTFVNLNKLIISSNSRLANDFIVAVARSCPNLSYLDAGRTRIDDMCVTELASRCPYLEFFDISRCASPTVQCLTSLARYAKNLAEFDVSFCPKVLRSEDVVPFLHLCVGCTRLKRFSIDYPPAGGIVAPDPPADVGTASETVRLLYSRFGTISGETAERKRVLNLSLMRDNWIETWRRVRERDMGSTDEEGWLLGDELRDQAVVRWWLEDVRRVLEGDDTINVGDLLEFVPPH